MGGLALEMMDTILCGDALTQLRTLPSESIHCCVSSPPYFGLRDYGHSEQIGQEPSLEAYVARLVEVFREVRRVLRRDGTLWLNLGDAYAAGGGADYQRLEQLGARMGTGGGKKHSSRKTGRAPTPHGLKPKDLLMIPARVALALQADGWYLRADIIWHKPNPMPESVSDRPTKAHEYIFLLAKSDRYYYDADAIREPQADPHKNYGRRDRTTHNGIGKLGRWGGDTRSGAYRDYTSRNKRSVWTIATRPFAGAHFAVMPEPLVEPCVLAGCPAHVCETCGAPWERVTENATTFEGGSGRAGRSAEDINGHGKWRFGGAAGNANLKLGPTLQTRTVGFRPTCRCTANTGAAHGVVLDPFMGSGTVGVVARRHSRHYLGVELNPDYVTLAQERIASERQPVLWSAAPLVAERVAEGEEVGR